MSYTPVVIEGEGKNERVYDIYSRLLKDNVIFLGDVIDSDLANSIVAQMLFLSTETPDKDIKLYINSPGGSITAGLAIFDTMNYIQNDIYTICIGEAASMAAFLLSSGTKGKRLCLPSARVLIHQPSIGGLSGQETDIRIHAKEILRMREMTSRIMAENTGHTIEKIEQDVERDYIMDAQEAVIYGIVDKIVKNKGKK